jgi:hypothetical protein
MKRSLRSQGVWVVLLVLAILAGWSGWSYSAARERLEASAERLAAAKNMAGQLGAGARSGQARPADVRLQLTECLKSAGIAAEQLVRLQPQTVRASAGAVSTRSSLDVQLEEVTLEQLSRALVLMSAENVRVSALRLTAARQRQTPERWRVEMSVGGDEIEATGEQNP